MYRVSLIAATVMACAASTQASSLLPAKQPLQDVIDHYIDQRIAADDVQTAAQVSDNVLLRRLTLDLAGRIPTTAELHAFPDSSGKNARIELVDRLLASPDFTFHQRNQLQLLLEYPDRRNDGEFRKYLLWAVEQNRPWDRMFRDMVAGDESDEYQQAALQFVKHRAKELDDLTNDTAILFFGVNISCAKCHDHPMAEDWKQDHYYGLQSFFSRTFLTKKDALAEKFYGDVKFTTTAGVDKQARFMFLNGTVVEDQTPELSKEERKKYDEIVKKLKKEKEAKQVLPKFRPRQELVEVALQKENRDFLARNIVNRVWHRLMGRGLVQPPDQMHSGNPPSHPELLEWLARDTVENGYDLKRLIRGIVLSQAYSRSSEWTSATEPPSDNYFAVAIPRALTPRQFAASLLVASRSPEHWEQWSDKPAKEWKAERERLENSSNGWANHFEIPGENFQVAVDEALLFSNSDRVRNDLLRDSGDRLVGHLKEMEDDEEALTTAFEAICSRQPAEEELKAVSEYLKSRNDNRTEGLRQIVWALLTGPEIRFNY